MNPRELKETKMSREEQIKYLLAKNPTMSYAQAVYYVDHVLGMIEEWDKITNG